MIQYDIAYAAQAALGECPRWHKHEARLYWVDIAQQRLHRFDPLTGHNQTRQFQQPIGCFAFCKGGGLMLGMKEGSAYLADWQAEPKPFGPQIFQHQPDLRFNDGRTDMQGNFWIGSVNMTKSAPNAALYRLSPEGDLDEIESDMMTCNGAAFSADGMHFMHADSPSHALRHYNVENGTLAHRQIFHQFPHGHGRPDGGTFDMAGFYWTALFDGGRVVRLAPSGEIVEDIVLPTKRPTMIAFGGADNRTAYVTTARTGLTDAELNAQPHAGDLFTFQVDVPGVAEHDFG